MRSSLALARNAMRRFMLRYEIFTCTQNKRSKGSTCGQALVRHCQKFHVQTQLWVPTLESAWQVGERKRLIFLADDLQNTWKNTVEIGKRVCRLAPPMRIQTETLTPEIKGPDNPTSQLLPILSKKSCCGDGEGRKDKGRGGGKMVCDKVVCVKDGV